VLAQGMRGLLVSQPDLGAHQLDEESARRLEALYKRTAHLQQVKDAVWYECVGNKYVYYTFAGATENQVLRLLFEENGVACQPVSRAEGIALTSRERLDFDCLPDDADEVSTIVAAHWRRFAGWINSGPFFEHLPPALKRDEIAAQVATSTVIERVTTLCSTPLVTVDLQFVR